jgi:hypothetical protein
MHDPGAIVAAPRSERDPHSKQDVHQRSGPAASGRMGNESGRLRHDQKLLILVPDRHAAPARLRAFGWRKVGHDAFASGQPERPCPRTPIDGDPTLSDGTRRGNSRDRGQPGQHGVEATRYRFQPEGHR